MTARHAFLPLGAVLVLALGVYLFVEVRAQPAPIAPAVGASRPEVTPEPPPAPEAPPDEPSPLKPPPPPIAPTVVTPGSAVPPPISPEVTARAAAAGLPVGPKLDAAMAEANKAYDRGDFEEAKSLAGMLLASDPTNVRMLRIMVSSSCLDGDSTVAQAHYAKLPPGDQEQMKVRCARYGITFPDKL